MKRYVLVLFAVILSASCLLCSCKKEAPATADETITKTEESAPHDASPEMAEAEDLLGLCQSFAWRGTDGLLQGAGDYAETVIRTKADLAPYRKFLTGLSDDQIDRMTSDQGGACLLVEMTPSFELSDFSTAGISREAGNIIITIMETESETPAPAHTFFLFYFPSSLYHAETIRVLFS